MKVAVFSAKPYEIPFLKKANNGILDLCFIEQDLNPESVVLAKGADAVSIFTNDSAGAEVLEKLKELNILSISTRAAGYDNIDINKAASLNIKVANVPEYSPYSIAEHTIAMILAMNRKIIRANQKVKDYDFRLNDLIGFDLHGKTAGIIGLGKIGSIVAKILHGFGCHILGYDVEQDSMLMEKYGVEYVSLEQLCRMSDIITLHAPLNADTRHMINNKVISGMKSRVMIVNTGRGPLIKTSDMIEALKDGKIGYLGLDVYENEKGLFFHDHSQDIPKDDMFARLLSFKNVLVTGHQAFLTENALKNIADTTIYNLTCFRKNLPNENELTSKIYAY